MKKLLFGIALVLALMVTPKAHAYPYACTGALYGDIVIQGTTATYWEACVFDPNDEIEWFRVSWWSYQFDIHVNDGL